VGKKVQRGASSRPDQVATLSFEALAAQQGVVPAGDFDALIGNPTPGDESLDDFSAMLREWRREKTPDNECR